MSQFQAITETGVGPMVTGQAVSAWLARRPLETARVLHHAGLPLASVGEVITTLAKSEIRRNHRAS